jgi:hypothetical protein
LKTGGSGGTFDPGDLTPLEREAYCASAGTPGWIGSERMVAGKPYNRHESWSAENVALWIEKDYDLYDTAVAAILEPRRDGKPITPKCATHRFLHETGLEGKRTPDGALYSFRSVRLAIADLMAKRSES